MFQGSHEGAIQINPDRTREIVLYAHHCGISIEAEVGSISGIEDGVAGGGEIADPNEWKTIADTGVDFLAAGIGIIHGLYPDNWTGLNFDALAAIRTKTGELPLVIHGGTGIPVDQVNRAIENGVCKINVNSDLQVVFAEAVRKYIEAGKDLEGKGYDPRKIMKPGREAVVERTMELMKQFGSAGKGWDC